MILFALDQLGSLVHPLLSRTPMPQGAHLLLENRRYYIRNRSIDVGDMRCQDHAEHSVVQSTVCTVFILEVTTKPPMI